jgi:HK97 family phage portal protein
MTEQALQTIEKASVTISPPGGTTRWALLGPKNNNEVVHYGKRQQYGIFYEMYRQHPVVRSAIDKKATYAVAGGYQFVPESPKDEISDDKVKRLKLFFRRSNSKQLLRHTYKDLDIYGESFWLIIRSISDTRTPMKAVRLNPRYVTPRVDGRGKIVKWVYGPVMPGNDPDEYDPDVILHFKIDDVEDDTRGLSPLHSLQRTVAMDLFAMDYTESFYKNSATTGTIFIVKTASGDEAKRNREWLEANYVGTGNAHRPILLEGDVDIKKSVASSLDMQYMEGRVQNRREICAVLEVDETKLGIFERRAQMAAEEAENAFHQEVIFPRQQIVEDEINDVLIWKIFGWNNVVFQHREGDARRKKDQAEIWDRHQKSGRFSINEIRQEMGRAPITGGDTYFVMTPAGAIPVELLGELARRQFESTPDSAVVEPVSGIGTDTFGDANPRTSYTEAEKDELRWKTD